jgi:acyl transferase domain-containing protein
MSKLPLLLPLSAKSEGALRRLAEAYSHMLTAKEGTADSYEKLLHVCMAAGTRRAHCSNYRLTAVGRSAAEVSQSLESKLKQGAKALQPLGPPPEVVFLFTGQGVGYMGMGSGLYEHNAVFHAAMDECDAIMTPLLDGLSILKVGTPPRQPARYNMLVSTRTL